MKRATKIVSLRSHAHYVMNDKKQGTTAALRSSLMLFEFVTR